MQTGLPKATRPRLEHAFGMDLSSVRVHADSPAAAAMGAEAFARGSEIHFAPGRHDASGGDPHLLAHEVAHLAQQAEGRVAPTVQAHGAALNEAPHLEVEADRMADDALAGRAARTGPRLAPVGGGVAHGYFTHARKQLAPDDRKVLAVRAALVRDGATEEQLKTFDDNAASPTFAGTLASVAPRSVAEVLRDFGMAEPPEKLVSARSNASSSISR